MKVHELVIVASLVVIVQQCILRDLLLDGLLLGLLGAEGAVANPSFLISKRFRLAVKFGIQSVNPWRWSKNTPDHWRTVRLLSLMFFCCMIAGLAGPASAVPMIPRVGWFFRHTGWCSPVPRSTIPTIMIGTAPGLLNFDAFVESNLFALPNSIVGTGFQYWQDMLVYELRNEETTTQDKARDQFHDSYGQVYVNTSGSHERPLDGDWTGATRITTTTRNNIDLYHGFPTEISLPVCSKAARATNLSIPRTALMHPLPAVLLRNCPVRRISLPLGTRPIRIGAIGVSIKTTWGIYR